jgi:urease accessory protein
VVPCEAYILHPPGGLVTGDALEVEAVLTGGAKVLVTTPSAAKFYRAGPGRARNTDTTVIL